MASIGARTFNLIEDRYLALANEEFVRTLAIGNDWTKLRLGVLLAVTPNGTSALGGTTFMLGVCSGKTSPFGAASTTNFVGAALHTGTPGATTGTLGYGTSGDNPYFVSDGTWPAARVGTTLNSGTGDGTTVVFTANTGSTQRRSPLFVDIQKGSPNYTITRWVPSAAQAQFLTGDCTPVEFLAALEATPPTWLNLNLTGLVATVAASEAPGALDTFDVLWNKTVSPLEIYALAAYRLA
jgi:hypothetical protein